MHFSASCAKLSLDNYFNAFLSIFRKSDISALIIRHSNRYQISVGVLRNSSLLACGFTNHNMNDIRDNGTTTLNHCKAWNENSHTKTYNPLNWGRSRFLRGYNTIAICYIPFSSNTMTYIQRAVKTNTE